MRRIYENTQRNSQTIGKSDFEITSVGAFSGERKAEIATDVGVNLVGGYELRTTGIPPAWKYARFECGNSYQFRGDSAAYPSKTAKYKESRKGKGEGNSENYKGKKGGREGKNKGKDKNQRANVMLT